MHLFYFSVLLPKIDLNFHCFNKLFLWSQKSCKFNFKKEAIWIALVGLFVHVVIKYWDFWTLEGTFITPTFWVGRMKVPPFLWFCPISWFFRVLPLSFFYLVKSSENVLLFYLNLTWICGSWNYQRILKK